LKLKPSIGALTLRGAQRTMVLLCQELSKNHMTTVSANKFLQKLFFFESVKNKNFQIVVAITFLLGNENQAAKTSQWRKLFAEIQYIYLLKTTYNVLVYWCLRLGPEMGK
jgi:hypothetical protein